jgi:hypothetical protein
MTDKNKKGGGLSHNYKVLGLSMKDAISIEVLQSAYKKKAREWHPDLNSHRIEEAAEKFREVQKAYNALLFLIKKEGGDLPPGVLNAHEFFSHFGHDHLASMTEETLEEISLSRAALGLSASGEGGATVGALDGKLMGKLKMWSRGPEYKADVKILDADGHFTDEAVKNILEFAIVYETANTVSKRKKVFGAHEVMSEDTSEYDVRLAEIIREWVYENYSRTSRFGWIHKSKAKYLAAKLTTEVEEVMAIAGTKSAVKVKAVSAMASGKYEEAQEIIHRDAYRFKEEKGEEIDEGEGDTGEKPKKTAKNKLTTEVLAVEKELKAIAAKCGFENNSMEEFFLFAGDPAVREENLVLDAMAGRIKSLAEKHAELQKALKLEVDKAPKSKAEKNAVKTKKDVEKIFKMLIDLSRDVLSLAEVRHT